MMHNTLKLLSAALESKRRYKKGYLSQIKEIVKLRLSTSQLGAHEYYQFGLSDDTKLSEEDKYSFLGWRGRRLVDQAFNNEKWHSVTSDKILTYLLLKQVGLPCARIVGAYDLKPRAIKEITFCTDSSSLYKFLSEVGYPIFVKPVDAALGRDTFILFGFDSDKGILKISKSKRLAFEEFHQRCLAEAKEGSGGYIFQELVKPYRKFAKISAGKLAGLRLIVLNSGSVPILTHAVIKFPTGENITDNFCSGETGNLIGRVNLTSGEIEEVFGLSGTRYVKKELHPDSGIPFRNEVIPEWKAYTALVLSAATLLPGLQLQHWDLAIAEGGPILLEVNVDGCLELPQIAYQKGFLCGAIKAAFERITCKEKDTPPMLPIQEPLPDAL